MAETAKYIVDPLDAEYAISDIQGILNNRGMSTTDLAVELGWKRKQVEEFLYGTDVPSLKQFEEVAKALDYELDFQE